MAIPSSILCSRWNRSSSSSSRSTARRRRIDLNRKNITFLSLRKLDDLRNGRRQPPPVRRFRFQLLPSRTRERIELRAPVILRLLPFGGDPAFLLQLVESRIKRAFAYLENISRGGFQ